MTIINDYVYQRGADQRQHDLAAEGDNRRLVRIARSGRPSWWQRLLGLVDDRTQPEYAGTGRPALEGSRAG
jgi:hypothetical protein